MACRGDSQNGHLPGEDVRQRVRARETERQNKSQPPADPFIPPKLQRDVDLGAVEGSVPLVQLPLEAGCVERLLEPLLGRVPHLDLLQELLRTAAAGR